jgi:hypothetical protein
LYIPDATDVKLYSAATESENLIQDCFVVAFDGMGAYKNAEKIDVSKIVNNRNALLLLPQMSFKPETDDRIYVVCNTGLTSLPTGINAESDMDVKFKPAKDYYFGGEALPMSGNIVWSSSSTAVTMIRAVAKIEILLGETFSVGVETGIPLWEDYFRNFDERLCGFVASNYAGKSDIMQPASLLSQNLSGHNAFYGTESGNRFLRFSQYAASLDSMCIYISEYPNSIKDCEGHTISDNVFNEKRAHILMVDRIASGTSILGDGTSANVWRLDFYNHATQKYIDIKRNHRYVFTVNKIRSAPYVCKFSASPAKAANLFDTDQEIWHNPGSNIEYEVHVDESWAKYNDSNGQYALSIRADTIRNANTPFLLKAQVPAGVNASQIGTHELYIYNRLGQPIGSTGSDLEVAGYPNASDGIAFPANGSVTTLNFTVNDLEYLDSAYMIIKLGNIYKLVPIMFDLYPWIYMPDPAFRQYCQLKGFISAVNPEDNNYIRLSPAGRTADTLNMQRQYPIVKSCYNLSDVLSDVDMTQYGIVSDLTGIEAFGKLEYLYVGGNNLTSIDVSKNRNLIMFSAPYNPIAKVNTGKSKALSAIYLPTPPGTRIDTVDISYNSPEFCILTAHCRVLVRTLVQKQNPFNFVGSVLETIFVPSPYSAIWNPSPPEDFKDIYINTGDNGKIHIRGRENDIDEEKLKELREPSGIYR